MFWCLFGYRSNISCNRMTRMITVTMMTMATMFLLFWIVISIVSSFLDTILFQNRSILSTDVMTPIYTAFSCVGSYFFQSLRQEWLHFAFPNECPYPHLVEEAKALTPSHWFDKRVSVEPGQHIHLASTAEEETSETAASSEIAWASQDLCQRRWQNGGFLWERGTKLEAFNRVND